MAVVGYKRRRNVRQRPINERRNLEVDVTEWCAYVWCVHVYIAWFGSCLNCLVHVVMYSYYGLSVIPSLKGKLWWKRYITRFQLVSFMTNPTSQMRHWFLPRDDTQSAVLLRQGYYWGPIGIHIHTFDWCRNQWPWMTLKGHYALCAPRCCYLFIFSFTFSLLLVDTWLPVLQRPWPVVSWSK